MPRSVQLSKNLIKNDTDRLTLISGPCLLENEKLVRKVAQSLITVSYTHLTLPTICSV